MKKAVFGSIMLMVSLVAFSMDFDKSEYSARRAKLMDRIPDGIAVIQGAQSLPAYYQFFQNNDFQYLTGLEIPDAVLVVDGIKRTSTVFFTMSESSARGEGIPVDEVTKTVEISGIEARLEITGLSLFLKSRVDKGAIVYTMFQPEELMRECSREKGGTLRRTMTSNIWDGRATREQNFIRLLKDNYPGIIVKDCSQMIWDLRTIKSPAEIDLIRKAGRLAVEAHKEMMKGTRVGMPEYELAALFEYANKKRGAQDLAYYTIICAGENHPFLHYHKYDGVLQDGDFLVIDGGPDYHYYDIDITVSYPVNGKFTPRQREIYEACNAIHEACMKVYRPGLNGKELGDEVAQVLKEMGYDTSQPIWKNFRASFGHYVGMAVHDVGGGPTVLKPGMVFANEPLAVFASENLGVRVEDTILITESGCENLTAGIPRTVEEIEAFMRR